LFRLNDVQWAAIEPHLPMPHTGPRRVDDRRVLSGIIHRLREGCRWRALPPEYGPYTTVFNRWNRWSQRGLWQRIFAALVACADPPPVAVIDSSAVKADRSAAGAKKGVAATPATRRAAARAAGARPRSTPPSTTISRCRSDARNLPGQGPRRST
jgi:transposase